MIANLVIAGKESHSANHTAATALSQNGFTVIKFLMPSRHGNSVRIELIIG